MSSSSNGVPKAGAFRNVPPPPGSKAGNSYARFIPREELGTVTSWQPGALAEPGTATSSAPADPAERRQTPRPGHPAAVGADANAAAQTSEAEWRARIATARRQGYQDGYRDGTAALEGFKQTYSQQTSAQLGSLIEAFDAQFAALDQHLSHSVAQTAVLLAQQVLRAELQQHPGVVAQVATEAINTVLLSAQHISVHVHPADLPLVASGAEEALRARGARLLPDATLERGGVLVVSDVGSVNATMAVRWAQACATLGVDPAGLAASAEPTQTVAKSTAQDSLERLRG